MKTLLQNKRSHLLCSVLFVFCMFASVKSHAVCTASFYSVPDSAGTGVSFFNTSTGTSGTTTYIWNFGDGSGSFNQNDHHQYANSGWYQVCLTIYDSLNGCQSSFCDSLFAGTNGILCQASFTSQSNGLTASFQDQSAGSNLNYHWDFGDGATASGQNATHTYAIPGQYLVCLTIWNFSCSDTTCSYVTVTSGGTCQASFYSIDSAGVTYFINTSTPVAGIPSYVWDFGDGTFGYNQYENHNYNSTAGFYACLTITYTDSNQTVLCTSTYCDSANVGGGSSTCQASMNWVNNGAGQINFTDLSTASDSIVSWYWTFGDGSTSTLQNPSHTYTQSGTYYVCLTISASNLNGTITCTNSSCSYIQIQLGGGGCQASFVAFDSAGVFYFVNTSTGTNFITTSYYWDFGDGSTSTDQSPVHNYNTVGPFWVCLTISDSALGCTSTFCDSVGTTSGNNCQASFIAVPDSGAAGYTFYNNSTGTNQMTSYLWTVSDNTTATGTVFHHIFSTQGWYLVCLSITVYDSLQNITCTSTTCDSVYIGNGGGATCNAFFGYQGSLFSAFFADLSTGTDSIVTWTWDFGDGNSSTQQNPVHTYAQSGYYNVCLTIETGSAGAVTCTDIYCQTIYAGLNNTGCQANFSMSPDSSGMGFQFQNISTGTSGTTTYFWDFGDGATSTLENPFHLFANNGWYTVCLTIADSAANCTSTYCDTLNIGMSFVCNPYFVWSGDTMNGVQFYQFNNNLPGIYYEWNFGDGDSSTIGDPYHQYATAGTYYACLTIFQVDSNGVTICSGSYCDSVYTGSNAPACAPQIVAVPDSNAWGNGNVSFFVYSPCGNISSVTWDFGDGTTGTGMNPSHQYTATGWYVVCVDVDINGIIYQQCDSIFALRLMGIEEASNTLSSIAVYPNPASGSISVSYALSHSENVSVKIYDLTGRIVRSVGEQKETSGIHKMVVDLEGISEGMYVIRITADSSKVAKRIVVSR